MSSKDFWDGIERVSCKICGAPTIYLYTELCDMCWGVERGIEKYVGTKIGRNKIEKLIKQIKRNKNEQKRFKIFN